LVRLPRLTNAMSILLGMKPWAEFCSPCGAQNKGLSPRIVGLQPFGANHPIPYLRAILTDPFILAAPWSYLAAN
jgi:hypothetical protein